MRNKAIKSMVSMLFCLCFVMVICATLVSAAEPIVVFTADFENYISGERPKGWNGQGIVVQDVFYGGKASLFVEDTNTTEYVEERSPSIAIKPGATYEVSVVSCVSDVPNGGRFGFYLREYDAQGKALKVHMLFLEKSSTWTEFRQQIQASDTAVSIIISIYPAAWGANNIGSAWVDDIMLAEVQ